MKSRLAWIGLLVCLFASPVVAAEFHIGGPAIELRRLQYCDECNGMMVVTTIAPGAAVRCPHCSSVQRRLPNRLLKVRVYQICPSCASRLDLEKMNPMQQVRCGTCGLAQYVLAEAVRRAGTNDGTGRPPRARVVDDADGREPAYQQKMEGAAPTQKPASAPDVELPELEDPGCDSAADQSPSTAQRANDLPAFDPRDPEAVLKYSEQEARLSRRRQTESDVGRPDTSPIAQTPAPRQQTPVQAVQPAPVKDTQPLQEQKQPAPAPMVQAPKPVVRQRVAPVRPPLPPMPTGDPALRPAPQPQRQSQPAQPPRPTPALDEIELPEMSSQRGPLSKAEPTIERGVPTVEEVAVTAAQASRQQAQARMPMTMPVAVQTEMRTAATVNGNPILVGDVERALRGAMEALRTKLGAEANTEAGRALLQKKKGELRSRIVDTLIGRELIRQAAVREGYRPDEQKVYELAETLTAAGGNERPGTTLEQARFQLLMKEMHHRHGRIDTPVRPVDVRSYYDEHPEAFMQPAAVQLQNIVLYRDRSGRSDSRSCESIANEIQRKLGSGVDFDALVNRYSEGPFREQGGRLIDPSGNGTNVSALTQPVRMAMHAKPAGAVFGPVRTVTGLVICRIDQAKPAAPVPFATVSTQIRDQLVMRQREAAFEEWVESLRKKATIKNMTKSR